MSQVETGGLDQLPLGADAFEEHHQLQLEKDHRVDRGAPLIGIGVLDPLTEEAEIQRGFEMAVEMILGNEILSRDGDRLVQMAGFRGAEHGALPDAGRGGNGPQSTGRSTAFFNRLDCLYSDT